MLRFIKRPRPDSLIYQPLFSRAHLFSCGVSPSLALGVCGRAPFFRKLVFSPRVSRSEASIHSILHFQEFKPFLAGVSKAVFYIAPAEVFELASRIERSRLVSLEIALAFILAHENAHAWYWRLLGDSSEFLTRRRTLTSLGQRLLFEEAFADSFAALSLLSFGVRPADLRQIAAWRGSQESQGSQGSILSKYLLLSIDSFSKAPGPFSVPSVLAKTQRILRQPHVF